MDTWDQVLVRNAKSLKEDVRRRALGEKSLRHIRTGFRDLDSSFGGVRIGVPTEVIAHTGDGKSALLRQFAEGCARDGGGVLWLVGEDPEDATAERQFAGDTGIDSMDIGRLELSTAQLDQIDLAVKQAAPWAKRIAPVFDLMTVDEVLQTVDETTTIGGSPLREVVLDYVQIFGDANNLEAEVARLGLEMQTRSKERRLAVLLGSQVSNDVVKRGRERYQQTHDIGAMRPSIGDTEWCKRLEKTVKAVWSMFRPNRWAKEFGDAGAVDDVAELHVIKQNFGSMGWIPLKWDGPTTRFSDGDSQ
jgi:replicative DNA helicase